MSIPPSQPELLALMLPPGIAFDQIPSTRIAYLSLTSLLAPLCTHPQDGWCTAGYAELFWRPPSAASPSAKSPPAPTQHVPDAEPHRQGKRRQILSRSSTPSDINQSHISDLLFHAVTPQVAQGVTTSYRTRCNDSVFSLRLIWVTIYKHIRTRINHQLTQWRCVSCRVSSIWHHKWHKV
jgi:hypothetical protein